MRLYGVRIDDRADIGRADHAVDADLHGAIDMLRDLGSTDRAVCLGLEGPSLNRRNVRSLHFFRGVLRPAPRAVEHVRKGATRRHSQSDVRSYPDSDQTA
jgi:hypothetical protein